MISRCINLSASFQCCVRRAAFWEESIKRTSDFDYRKLHPKVHEVKSDCRNAYLKSLAIRNDSDNMIIKGFQSSKKAISWVDKRMPRLKLTKFADPLLNGCSQLIFDVRLGVTLPYTVSKARLTPGETELLMLEIPHGPQTVIRKLTESVGRAALICTILVLPMSVFLLLPMYVVYPKMFPEYFWSQELILKVYGERQYALRNRATAHIDKVEVGTPYEVLFQRYTEIVNKSQRRTDRALLLDLGCARNTNVKLLSDLEVKVELLRHGVDIDSMSTSQCRAFLTDLYKLWSSFVVWKSPEQGATPQVHIDMKKFILHRIKLAAGDEKLSLSAAEHKKAPKTAAAQKK